MLQPYKCKERRAKFNRNIDKCVETIYQQPKLLKAWLRDSPTVDLSTTVENPLDSNVRTGSTPVLGTTGKR